MLKRTGFYLIFLWSLNLHGQVLMNKDSLLLLLPMAKDDTNAVQLYINLGQQYESNEPEIAKMYYRKAGLLSEKINYRRGVIQYINNYTFVLNMQGIKDSSLLLNLNAVEIAREINDSLYLAKALFNTGTSYRQLEDYENAVKFYEEGKKIFEKYGDEFIEAQAGDILQLLYYEMKNYDRAIEFGEKSVATFRKINNPIWLGYALNNLGLSYSSIEKFDKALPLFTEALALGLKNNDKIMESSQALNIGNIYLQKGEYQRMMPYMKKALVLARELDNVESEAIALKGLSFYYTFLKDYKTAEKYADSSLKITFTHNFKKLRAQIYTQLSNLAYANRDMELGEHYARLSSMLGDSLINDIILKNTQLLEKQFETEKKEAEIHHLTVENQLKELSIQKKSLFNYLLVGGLSALFIITILVYRNLKHKQTLQQQKIGELETEKQLMAAEAVLKGEEQERTRIAKDLHDGLGGMLSGLKHSFVTIKGNLIMTPENVQAFERGMDMLDSSIKEMRRVAHNMMPEALVRFGLDTALKDFCNDINQSGAIVIDYHSVNLKDIQLEQTTSITIYRIIQELINNVIKHANATSAIVQLIKTDEKLAITVEDNGKGFDTSILLKKNGIGWINIKNRVEFLKGTLDITSRKNEGTSVQIEFNS